MGLALVLVCTLLALPAPALATPPEELTIEAVVYFSGSMPSTGTFQASGLFVDSGNASVWSWYANGFNVHSYALVESAEGTILLHSQGLVSWPDPDHPLFEGRWVVLDGTGAYEKLHGIGDVVGAMDTTVWPISIHWTWTGTGHFD
jgi:hypothetical protein